MADYDSVDFFADESLLEDPYPYFDHLRSQCPVVPTPHHGVVAVSGYEEASEIYLNTDDFSSCNSVIGPFAMFPVPLEGDDVGADHRHPPRPAAHERAHGDDGPARPHARAVADHAAADAEAAQGERGVHVAPGRPPDRRVRRRRPLRVHPRLHAALRHARRRRRARRARGRPPTLPRGLRAERVTGQDRCRGQGHERQRAGVARRLVRRVHRGPSARATRRHPDRPRARHLPRRLDARRGQRRAHGDLPLRGGPGDDGPSAWRWA